MIVTQQSRARGSTGQPASDSITEQITVGPLVDTGQQIAPDIGFTQVAVDRITGQVE